MSTEPVSRRRTAWRVGAAAAVVALPVLFAGPVRAAPETLSQSLPGAASSGPPQLGGWNITADGNAVDVLIDNTTGLAGIHPLTEADFPEAQSQFATGPFGSGLATVFWPGSAGGNFGSLSTELGFPAQLQPIATQLNDPIKASAQYPAGPASSDYPAGAPGGLAVMHATAQPDGTTAEGSIADEAPSSVLMFSSAKGTSSATATDKAVADSASDLSGVSLLGGLIQIGSITSTAHAVSDGTNGSGTSVTHVSEVTVLGQKASIGSDGLILPNFPSSLGALTGPIVQNAISQVISGLGLTVTEFPAVQKTNGAGFATTSGGVSVRIDPPSSAAPLLEQAASVLAPLFPSQAAIVPTLPGLLQGYTMTITLGRASASANASGAFSSAFNPPPIPPGAMAAVGSAAGPSSGSTSATPALGGAGGVTGVSPSVADAPSSGTGGATPSTSGQPASTLIGLSEPLAVGAVLLAILVTLFASYGLWRVSRMLLPTDHGPACPLGQDQN